MANINKNIVETRKLASKGRFGDTEIREVDNAPAHVNAYEAYLLDNHGNAGEEVVKDIGAGTTNPQTGMKEYHWKLQDPLNMHHNREIWGNKAVDYLYGENNENLAPGMAGSGLKGAWNWLMPVGHTGFFSSEKDAEYKAGQQAGRVTGVGMEGLLKQQEEYMGPEGFITREKGLEEKGISDKYQTTMETITKKGDKLRSKSDLAYSGEIETTIDEMGTSAMDQYTHQMELSDLKSEKTEVDFMSNLREKLNQMLIDYQGAAGKPYGGGSALDELNQLFASYDAEGSV
tara:strand:+ start:6197 stop:7060 length:864 start_codon:yes stop_codon:yes gene_type:complete